MDENASGVDYNLFELDDEWVSEGYQARAVEWRRDAGRAGGAPGSRIRKEITSLSQAELDNLKKAFSGILAKDKNDPNSYFVQAGHHWLPSPVHCQHHAPAYNPWHRAYLISFESALRSVPGCGNVVLPYWDITTPFPEVLKNPPFNSYTLPEDIGQGFKAGYVTSRFDYATIQQNLAEMRVTEDINRALAKTD